MFPIMMVMDSAIFLLVNRKWLLSSELTAVYKFVIHKKARSYTDPTQTWCILSHSLPAMESPSVAFVHYLYPNLKKNHVWNAQI